MVAEGWGWVVCFVFFSTTGDVEWGAFLSRACDFSPPPPPGGKGVWVGSGHHHYAATVMTQTNSTGRRAVGMHCDGPGDNKTPRRVCFALQACVEGRRWVGGRRSSQKDPRVHTKDKNQKKNKTTHSMCIRTSLDMSERSSSPVSSATGWLLLRLLRGVLDLLARALGGLPDDESRPVELAAAGILLLFFAPRDCYYFEERSWWRGAPVRTPLLHLPRMVGETVHVSRSRDGEKERKGRCTARVNY